MNSVSSAAAPNNEIIHESRLTPVQVGILLFGFVAYLLEGYDILVISFAAPAITEELQVSPDKLGMVFSAGLLGMTIGAMFLGALADVYGRRIVVSLGLMVAGLATSAVILTSSVTELLVARFVAGLALGALVVSLPSLVSEFSPRRYRTLILSILFSASSLGSVFGGLVSAAVIDSYGWRNLFFTAGMATMALGVIAYFFIPETISFIVKRRPENAFERVNHVLRYIGHEPIERLPQLGGEESRESASVVGLFSPSRRTTTILMWSAFLFGYAAVYFFASWVPQIMRNLGVSHEQAIRSGVVVAVGGMVGTALIGWLGRWWVLSSIVTRAFYLAVALVIVLAALTHVFDDVPIMLSWMVLFGIGMTLMGGFANLYTVVLTIYPPQIRNTGLGWCSGIGRVGAVVSPALAGLLIALAVPLPAILLYFAVPVLVAALTLRLVSMAELA